MLARIMRCSELSLVTTRRPPLHHQPQTNHSALGTAARCALFRLPPLQGDNAQRKAFLVALVSAARHPDAEVRMATAAALPAVFDVYPNR